MQRVFKLILLLATAGYALSFYASPAYSATPVFDGINQNLTTPQTTAINHFKPRPRAKTKLDYGVWTQLLEGFVVNTGPSTRIRSKSYGRGIGTRFRNGINEPYRLEGNKVLYPYIHPEIKGNIADYADELETLGNQLDIPALERNQQLAFWVNLHNVIVVREISKHYPGPKRRPKDIMPVEGSTAGLHTAKLLHIDGIALSLEDIRQRIVYPNWKNPDAAFAFYLGDVSSPSLADVAYEPKALTGQLKSNAERYANSLRGTEKGKVSRIYQDIAPWYFPNFEADLATYLKTRMREDVLAEYKSRGYNGIKKYQSFVNDITSGRGKGRRFAGPVFIAGDGGSTFVLGKDLAQFNSDMIVKVQELNRKEWFKTGTVIIEDIETDAEIEVK